MFSLSINLQAEAKTSQKCYCNAVISIHEIHKKCIIPTIPYQVIQISCLLCFFLVQTSDYFLYSWAIHLSNCRVVYQVRKIILNIYWIKGHLPADVRLLLCRLLHSCMCVSWVKMLCFNKKILSLAFSVTANLNFRVVGPFQCRSNCPSCTTIPYNNACLQTTDD